MIYYMIMSDKNCIADGFDRGAVINSANDYFYNVMIEDGEKDFAEDVFLIAYDEDKETETTEQLHLEGEAEE